MDKEIRTVPIELELRTDGENNEIVYGKAVVYNSLSNTLRTKTGIQFIEIIEPGFFDSVLDSDVIATIEHNPEKIVGRRSAGTLKITDTPEALLTENHIPPTTAGNDLKINIARGEIRAMSFAFNVKKGGDMWSKGANGIMKRTLLRGGCNGFYDVTYTIDPGYSDTAVAMRSMEKYNEEQSSEADPNDDMATEHNKRRIKLARLQLNGA